MFSCLSVVRMSVPNAAKKTCQTTFLRKRQRCSGNTRLVIYPEIIKVREQVCERERDNVARDVCIIGGGDDEKEGSLVVVVVVSFARPQIQ